MIVKDDNEMQFWQPENLVFRLLGASIFGMETDGFLLVWQLMAVVVAGRGGDVTDHFNQGF